MPPEERDLFLIEKEAYKKMIDASARKRITCENSCLNYSTSGGSRPPKRLFLREVLKQLHEVKVVSTSCKAPTLSWLVLFGSIVTVTGSSCDIHELLNRSIPLWPKVNRGIYHINSTFYRLLIEIQQYTCSVGNV